MFNIPDGSKKESPTSYMSLTNQKYPTQIMSEASAAQATAEPSKKQPKAKSDEAKNEPLKTITNQKPAEAPVTATTTAAKTPKALFEQIKQVGDSVRDLKAKKAPKVC